MTPTRDGFDIIKTDNGFSVTTLYDLFNINKKTILCEHKTMEQALEHKEICFENALKEYERCMKMGCSFPYND